MSYVKQWLKRNNMTPKQCAEELGVSQSLIEKLSCGKNKLRKVVKYALLWVEHSMNNKL